MLRNAFLTQWKKVDPLITKGIQFHGQHWKKFGLGGMAMGSAIGVYETSSRDDYYFRLTPCEKRVKLFENMYFDGFVGGMIGATPLYFFTGVLGAGIICVAFVSPVLVAKKLCDDNKRR